MKDPKLCCEAFCKNKRREGRRICATCDKRRWRKRHPMKAAYETLKYNTTRRAKQQGRPKPFTITFEDFKQFCYKTNYMAGKGRSKDSYSIDCKIEELGYVKGNLQKLTVSQNSIKEHKRRKLLVYDWRTGSATVPNG